VFGAQAQELPPPLTRPWAPLSSGGVRCTGSRTATPTHSSVGASVGRWHSVHGPKGCHPHSLVRAHLCRSSVHGPRTATPLTHSLEYINYPVNNESCAVDADSGVVLADDADAGDTASVRHNR
jgi:hypothetical protein